jgi:hypothetical protein
MLSQQLQGQLQKEHTVNTITATFILIITLLVHRKKSREQQRQDRFRKQYSGKPLSLIYTTKKRLRVTGKIKQYHNKVIMRKLIN